jgi:hypothetical protein
MAAGMKQVDHDGLADQAMDHDGLADQSIAFTIARIPSSPCPCMISYPGLRSKDFLGWGFWNSRLRVLRVGDLEFKIKGFEGWGCRIQD